MGGTLWLEAKAILGGSGPVCSARGLSGTGCGVRCSQPRAKPSDSYVPHLPMVTHSNQVEARENARVGTARRGSSAHSTTESYATFLRECGQHGPLSARCRDMHVGRSVWTLDAGLRLCSSGLLVPLALSGCSRLSGGGLGLTGGGAQGRSRASGRGGRGTSVWAGVPGVGPGPGGRVAPPGFGSGAGLSQKTPVAVDR